MGTPEFAVPSLEILLRNNYKVEAVVTVPDKPAGRGYQLKASAVKIAAQKNGLKVLQPENLNDEIFVQSLKDLGVNLIVVVAFRKLPDAVWQLPVFGTFNLHGSILPDYRGAAPLNWAIINGEKQTGVTTFFIDDQIDNGAIIDCQKIDIGPEDTLGIIHDRLMEIGANLVLKTVKQIESGAVKPIDQESVLQGRAPLKAPKIFRSTCKINWNSPAQTIHNLIRGLSPYPGAYSELILKDGQILTMKIFGSSIEQGKLPLGKIEVESNCFKVGTADGVLVVHELQLEGKKKTKAPEFLRGFQLNNLFFKV